MPTYPVTTPRRYPLAPLVGVATALFRDNGDVLLVQRGRPPAQGQWGLPGGLLDLGETLRDGAVREVREECGIEIALGEIVGAFEPIEVDDEGRIEYHFVVIDFWARYLSGEPVAQDDAAAIAWVALGELGEYAMTEETRGVIKKAHEMWRASFTISDF